MQKLALFTAAWLAFSLETAAQTAPCTAFPQAIETMHVNRLRMPRLRPGAVIDSGSSLDESAVFADYDGSPQPTAGLFASAIWVGGLDEGGAKRVSAVTHLKDNKFYFMAGPFGLSASECGRWDRFWSVGRAALAAHRADVADGNLDAPLPEILAWPGRGNPHFAAQNGFDLPNATDEFAPFFDADGDGMYDPFAGDFPHPNGVDTALVPGKIVWNLFSDPPQDQVPFHLTGMEFEYQWTSWVAACADTSDVLNDAVFFSLRLTNRSGAPMDSVVAGIWSDFDLGDYKNDAIGTAPDLSTVYVYNTAPNDILPGPSGTNEPVFKTAPPATAWTVFNQPLFKSIYYANPSVCNPPIGTTDPAAEFEYFNYLNGKWRDGNPLYDASTGYFAAIPPPPPTMPTDFVFDGNPADGSGWIQPSPPGACFQDVRQLTTTYLGTMLPNASKTIDYAFSHHRGPGLDHLQNVGYLFQRVADLRQRYAQNFADNCAPEPPCQADDCVWPGDANRDGIVNYRDLLPIGLSLNKTGPTRPGFVVWEGKTATDWSQLFNQNLNLKHTDANGDGRITGSDVSVMYDFHGLKTPDYQQVDDVYQSGDEIFIRPSTGINPDNVSAGNIMVASILFQPTPGLRGLAYAVEWDTLYWRPLSNTPGAGLGKYLNDRATETLFFHGTPGQAEISAVKKVDADLVPADVSTSLLSFRARALPPGTPPLTYIRLKNIKGIRADGSEIPLGSWPRQFCFGGGCALGAGASIDNQAIDIVPNPTIGPATLRLELDRPADVQLQIVNLLGAIVWEKTAADLTSLAEPLDLSGEADGLYLLRLRVGEAVRTLKLVKAGQ